MAERPLNELEHLMRERAEEKRLLQQQHSDEAMTEPEASFGSLVQRAPGNKVHLCISCNFPVAVFGRLYPCLHAYCLACASDMATCFL
jgi:hypothetical protein